MIGQMEEGKGPNKKGTSDTGKCDDLVQANKQVRRGERERSLKGWNLRRRNVSERKDE